MATSWPVSGSYMDSPACAEIVSLASGITGACAGYGFDLSLLPGEVWDALDAITDNTGASLRFTEDDGETAIYFKFEHYDRTGRTGWVWLAQPHGSSGATVDITSYCYAGDVALSTASSTSAYESAIQGRWCLQEAPTSSTAIKDATANARHSAGINGTMTSGDLVADAPYGALKSIDFDGNDGLVFGSAVLDACEAASRFTISGWAKPSDASADRALFGTTGLQLNVYRESAGTVGWYGEARNSANTGQAMVNAASGSTSAWQKVDFVWNGSNIYIYVDGVQTATAACTSFRSATLNWNIGYANGVWMVGRIGPCSVRSDALTADQIYTLWLAESSPSSVWAVTNVAPPSGSGDTGWKLFLQNANGGSGTSWGNLPYSLAIDANATTVDIPDTEFSKELWFFDPDYGVTIPAAAESYIVEFRFNRTGQSNSGRRIYDEVVRPIVGGALAGANLALTGTHWTANATVEYGPSWTITWDGTEFDSDFGFAIKAEGGTGNPNVLGSIYYAEFRIRWFGASSGVTGTAEAGIGLDGAGVGARGAAGEGDGGIGLEGEGAGVRGAVGEGDGGIGLEGDGAGVRGAVGTVDGGIGLEGEGAGARGVAGTGAGPLALDGEGTDSGPSDGTAEAGIGLDASALGYVGALGPCDGTSLGVYLTGAAVSGGFQRDPLASLGGFRSGTRLRSLWRRIDDAMLGLDVIEVAGANGIGVGALGGGGSNTATWTPPGATVPGPAVEVLPGAEAVLKGGDTSKWVRVRRTGTAPLGGSKGVTCLDVYNGFFEDVASDDAIAGVVSRRALMLRNDAAGAMGVLRAWLGDCDGAIEIAFEEAVAGELQADPPSGLAWSAGTTSGTGLERPVLASGGEVGLRVRRTVPGDTSPSPSQLIDIRLSWTDGVTTYTGAVRGRYRIAREDYITEGLWIGVDEYPAGPEVAPDAIFTSRPYTTSLGLASGHTYYGVVRGRNQWGVWGANREYQRFDVGGGGGVGAVRPNGPQDLQASQSAESEARAGAFYARNEDGATAAELWVVWVAEDEAPDPSDTPSGYATMPYQAAVADLAWTETGMERADGTPIQVLARTRRLIATGGTAFSPDMIQLAETGAGTLKVSSELSGWGSSGYATIRRSDELLEVIHYSAVTVGTGETTITVDGRAQWGTSSVKTHPRLRVEPVEALDSENTAAAEWTMVGVAPGRPWGGVLLGDVAAVAQAPIAGPDGVTPVWISEADNVYLLLGEGWASLYLDVVLVWRVIRDTTASARDALYVPDDWTLIEGAVSGAAVMEGAWDVVDETEVYLAAAGQRVVKIDAVAKTITALAIEEDAALPGAVIGDGGGAQWVGALLTSWEPGGGDWAAYAQATSAGLKVGVAIDDTLGASAIEEL